MAHGTGTNAIPRRHRIICFLMVMCFSVSYLPVTNYWYVSIKGQEDLTRLVALMARAKINIDNKQSPEAVNQAIDSLFKELKIAAGIVQPDPPLEKGKITLVEISPEFPVHPVMFRLRIDKKQLYGLTGHDPFYQSICLSIDTPPPEPRRV